MSEKLSPIEKSKIKSLLLKGFTEEEVAEIAKLDLDRVKKEAKSVSTTDLHENSQEFYSELQKDLSKLVITEMNKKEKKDSNVVLNAIKLQAELQEKKLYLLKSKSSGGNPAKISKDYLYKRDDEIFEMKKAGKTEEEIAKVLNLSLLGVKDAIDRVALELPEELKVLPPTVVTETKGLPREMRIEILKKAVSDDLSRAQVREIIASIKNNR